MCSDPSTFDADHISRYECRRNDGPCDFGDCYCHEKSCQTSAKVCEIDKRLTVCVDWVCMDAIHDCGKYKAEGMCVSKKYAEARENGYYDHNEHEDENECHAQKCKTDAAYCESMAGQKSTLQNV